MTENTISINFITKNSLTFRRSPSLNCHRTWRTRKNFSVKTIKKTKHFEQRNELRTSKTKRSNESWHRNKGGLIGERWDKQKQEVEGILCGRFSSDWYSKKNKIYFAHERRNDLLWRRVMTTASTYKYWITQLITSSTDQSIAISKWERKQWKDIWQSAEKELVELRNESLFTLSRNESEKRTSVENFARENFIFFITWIWNPRIQKG